MSFASLRRVLRSARKGLCATCSKTRYPQLEAAGAGHVGCLIYTLETIGTLIKDDHEVTALHVAARKGQISVLIYLVENDVVKSGDVFKARNGATPAHDAAGTGNLECLRYLLSRTQAGPNDLDNNAATPLHWAAQSGHLKVVQWLVAEALAPVDAVAKNGVTPFHLAAAKNHLDVLRWLVGFAFRHHNQPMKLVNAKDKNGSTPLYHAAHAGHINIVHWLATKGGGDPTVANRQGLAPLHAATIAGHTNVVQFLFQFGLATAPGGLRTSEGACSLHFAAAENHLEIIHWLLQQNECTGSERDYYHSTPLHDAAENGHIMAIKLLCDYNADPTLCDIEGNTPRDLASKHGHHKCASYLDNYIKSLMKSRINGSVTTAPAGHGAKLQRSKPTQGQMMDKYRHAPPHMMPVSAYDDDEYIIDNIQGGGSGQWETLHDLMDKEEIELLSQEQETFENDTIMTEAEQKRRRFEEKLAKEEAERKRKKEALMKEQEEQEMEIRSQFIKERHEDDLQLLESLKSFENTVKEGQRELASQLGDTTMQPNVAKKEKARSLPRSVSSGDSSQRFVNVKRTVDDMDASAQNKRGSVWISKLLRKRGNTPGNLPHSKSWDSSQLHKPRRPSADPYQWTIPNPPSPPSVEFLLGRSRVAHSRPKPNMSLKEELQQKTNWGRDAYDDHYDDDDGSDSDDSEKNKKLTQSKLAKARKRKKKELSEVPSAINKNLTAEPAKTPSPRQRRSLGQQHQDTSIPSLDDFIIPKSDLPPKRSQELSQPANSPKISPSNTTGGIPTTKPIRAAPPPPVQVSPTDESRNTTTPTAPIVKAVSARSKVNRPPPLPLEKRDTPLPSSFMNQLNHALNSSQGREPKALQSNHTNSPPDSPSMQETEQNVIAMRRQITPPQGSLFLVPSQGVLQPNRPKLQRQPAIDVHVKEQFMHEDGSDDSSFTSSSEEETESSEEDSNEELEDGDRPIMARNMGIHGARIAKEVMQRMKNQRYPSIFRKPIITLDTIAEIQHETVYQADNKQEMADLFKKIVAKRRVISAWRAYVRQLREAREIAEQMAFGHRRDLLANAFLAWIQAKNEAEAEAEERILEAHKYYQRKLKKRIIKKWKTLITSGVKQEAAEKKCLQWLNAQMITIGKPQVDDLFKSIADGVILILALANASGKKAPRFKQNPKIKIHRQDNWKVAYEFMTKIGINTKDFEPADLADLHEHAVYNMFTNIFRWTGSEVL